MRKSRAIIADILGPFPKGQKIHQFAAFEHTDTQHLYTDTTRPRTYHYRWAHERALGPLYHGCFDKLGHYSGKEYIPQQIAFAKALRLKWALKLKPSDTTNWHTRHIGSAKYGRLAPTQIKATLEPTTLDGLMKDLKEVLTTERNQEKYFDTLVKDGFYSETQLAILAGTLHIRTLFIFKGNRLEVPVQSSAKRNLLAHILIMPYYALLALVRHL